MSGHRSSAIVMGLVAAAAVLVAGCGSAGSSAASLPSVAASPAETPKPPATAPATPAAGSGAASTAVPSTVSGAATPTVPASTVPASTVPASTALGQATASGTLAACSDLTLALTSDKATYATGQTVHLTATLTNAGPASCTIQAGAQRGFAVASGSTAIWRSGCSSTPAGHTATEPCPQFLALMPLKAGQTLTRTQDWSQQADGTDKQVSAGSYLVAESWAGSNASTTITIS